MISRGSVSISLARTSETGCRLPRGARRYPRRGRPLRPNRSSSRCRRNLACEDGPCPASNEIGHRVTLQGPGEKVALPEPATQLPKPPELRRRLYPFGDCRQAEGAPDLDDRMNQAGPPPWIVERSHERPVDLDVGDWELLQVCQRRVSGPEVVDGDLNAQSAEGVEPLQGVGAVQHQDALGELEGDPARVRAGVRHGRLNGPG